MVAKNQYASLTNLMLAYSSSSTRSKSTLTDSTSLLANLDLEILEIIFERGKYATSFPQIFRPYTEVLQEHGISPTNDSTYYGLLLKVGVMKAPTWGDKWSIWKATQNPSSVIHPTYTPEKKTVYATETSHSGPDRSFSQSQLPFLRARVPFLASASSDIDEGFAASNDGQGQQSLVNDFRPSPRKEIAKRSLVGYTPEQSFDLHNKSDDLLEFDPPIRTSTPVLKSPKYQQTHDILNLPVYSVSDVSQALEETTEDFSALGLINPKGKSHSPIIDNGSTWVDRIDEIQESDRKLMEGKADDFYRLGLLGRCWDMWFKTSEFYRVTYKNIPIARNNLLLRQMLEKWSKATQHQLSLPGTADRHRRLSLKLKVFKTWAERLKDHRLDMLESKWADERRLIEIRELFDKWKTVAERRRTEKWKIDMAEKEFEFIQKRNGKLLKRYLSYWRIETRGKLAELDEKQRLTWDFFEEWYYLAMKQRDYNLILHDIQQTKIRKLFTHWRKKSFMQPKEDEIRQKRDTDIMREVLDNWRTYSWQAKQSSIFDTRRLLLMTIDKWKIARRNQKMMERKAVIFDETGLMDRSMKKWKLESWGRLLMRAKDKRLQEQTWVKWKNRQTGLVQLDNMANGFEDQKQRLALQKAFSRWRSIASAHQTDHLRAVLVYEKTLQLRVINKWQNSTAIVQINRGLADKAHAFFLLRSAFKVWRSEDAKRKAAKWIDKRNKQTIQETFNTWRHLTLKYRDLHRREAAMQRYNNQITLKKSLDKWTNLVIEIKDRELRITRARNDHVTSKLFVHWQGRLAVLRDNQKKADDTFEIRELENLRRIFRSWRGRTKRHKRLRLTAETCLNERDEKLVRGVFDRWYGKRRERALQEIEKEVAFLHENVILYGVMDKWKASTDILPGISADSTRLKREALHVWLVALARKRRADELQKDRDRKLLSEAFQSWRDATAHRAALNARRIRGRSRPSTTITADRQPSFGLRVYTPSQRISSWTTSGRRVTPNSDTFSQFDHKRLERNRNLDEGQLSPGLMSIGRNDNETVRSEPVYSRLRSELGLGNNRRRSRGASEEFETNPVPRSGSEMLRALKGNIPGR
uniref:Sfi1 spindle body domain-containing protein n=1 Tax=Kwoniella pini CBS 10737 TaxID=1296096 RepID=A0A1B9I0L5_9TREE|nr:uncharacterized protein I206_04741 [Kwoniella pini CBS 10737]OCF49054.1 hypothetical protein I206_04741 [Kwoniella pini CBS 10737]